MKYFIKFLLLIFYKISFSQPCDCKSILTNLEKKVSQNYAGFNDKVNNTNKKYYLLFLNKLKKESIYEKNIRCYNILQRYIDFFDGQHLSINLNIKDDNNELIDSFFANSPKKIIDTIAFKNAFDLEKIEGIWRINRLKSDYRILIKKIAKNKYVGVVLNSATNFWKQWQVKMEIEGFGDFFKIKYFLKNHSYFTENVTLVDDFKFNIRGTNWIKENKYNPDSISTPVKTNISFTKINEYTNLLTIKSFIFSNKIILDSIIKANDSILQKTPNLIIDIRDNGGGNASVYDCLLPYIYTQPIENDGTIFKSSNDNINFYKKYLKDSTLSNDIKDEFKELIGLLENNPGQMVVKDSVSSFTTSEIISKYPKKVGILYNRFSFSAAEMFVLKFRESKKVITFGENSGGDVDYGNSVSNAKLDCDLYTYDYALVKAKSAIKKQYDKIGIKPQITLIGDESTWINQIIELFKKK